MLEALDRHGTTREIAEALVVSPHTVKAQLQSVYRKLGVSSRRGAVVAARELGLLPEEERER
ncbi:LuxR C-terminal-related transcriptional regulator [Microbacterium sp. gxy059]